MIFVKTPSGATSGGKEISGKTGWTLSTKDSLIRLVMSEDLPESSSPTKTILTSLLIS